MLEWLNNRYGTLLVQGDLEVVKDFTLLWNIFEGEICRTNFTINHFEMRLRRLDITRLDYVPVLEYFRNRYVINGTTNALFERLEFRQNDRKRLVADVLCNAVQTDNEVVLALVIIVYRLRNNLFHGIKQMQYLGQQRQNFEFANRLLRDLIMASQP